MSYLKFNKTELINLEYSLKREILRTNQVGCYSSSTIIDCNTRKYHGLLICPLQHLDGGKHVLLSSLDETVIQHDKEFNLALHKYSGDNYEPKGHKYIRDFSIDPLPKLLYRVGGVILSKEKILLTNEERILIKYTLIDAHSKTKLRLRPFLAFRNIHALSKVNMDVNTKCRNVENGVSCKMYNGYPDLAMQLSKSTEFVSAPDWYYSIEYYKEKNRGYNFKEDLFVPGYFEMNLRKGESVIFSAGINRTNPSNLKRKFTAEIKKLSPIDNFESCFTKSINQFFITSGKKTEIIAGYPWLPVRLRDTFISVPGLTLSDKNTKLFTKVIDSALKNLDKYLFVKNNYNQIENYAPDIALWFIWSLQKYAVFNPEINIWKLYGKHIKTILNGYLKEKEHFEVHENGLIYIPKHLDFLNWMNAKINGHCLLSRSGYLVELNALWYNAVKFASNIAEKNNELIFAKKWNKKAETIAENFTNIFWDNDRKYLADYVNDTEINIKLRSNQVFASSMPYSPLSNEQNKDILDTIKQTLLTPYGLRTLAPTDEDYKHKHTGNHYDRGLSSFNGSIYPWLFVHYFEGLYKIYPKSALRAFDKFMQTIKEELQINGLCSISELYNADPPHKGKGAISFAKNIGELMRLKWIVNNN